MHAAHKILDPRWHHETPYVPHYEISNAQHTIETKMDSNKLGKSTVQQFGPDQLDWFQSLNPVLVAGICLLLIGTQHVS